MNSTEESQTISILQPISGVVGEVMKVTGAADKDYEILKIFALWFVEEYKVFVNASPTPFYVEEIPDNYILELPENYMSAYRCGILTNPGTINQKVEERSEDKQLSRLVKLGPASPPPPSSGPIQDDGFQGGNYNNGNLYGFYSGQRGPIRGWRPTELMGCYLIDKNAGTNGLIHLSRGVDWPNFYMDYETNCLTVSEATFVDPFALKALRIYLQHQWSVARKNNWSFQRAWDKAEDQMNKKVNAVSLKMIIDTMDSFNGYTN